MDGFELLGALILITSIASFLVITLVVVFTILTLLGQWRIHKALGCRWAWYIFFPVLNRIQILEMMKSEDNILEVTGKQIPYHIVSLYEYAVSIIMIPVSFIAIIPIIGSLVVTVAYLFLTGYIGKYYNARVIALLYGENPDEYEQYLKTGFWWSIFPFLPFFWLKKNM